jgi:hypothetical protein
MVTIEIKATDTSTNEYQVAGKLKRILEAAPTSRGLEGWTVVCLWMDDFIRYKIDTYDPLSEQQPSLGLFGPDEAKKDYAYQWSMIPFTRAIDTLVVTLRNLNSEYARILKSVYKGCQDFVEWIE